VALSMMASKMAASRAASSQLRAALPRWPSVLDESVTDLAAQKRHFLLDILVHAEQFLGLDGGAV